MDLPYKYCIKEIVVKDTLHWALNEFLLLCIFYFYSFFFFFWLPVVPVLYQIDLKPTSECEGGDGVEVKEGVGNWKIAGSSPAVAQAKIRL